MARVKIIGRCCVGEYEESLEKNPFTLNLRVVDVPAELTPRLNREVVLSL